MFTRLAVLISSKNSWPKHHQNGNAITHGCTKILKNYGTLHFRCLFLTEKYKKRLYPEFTKALHQPLTLTIQDDTLSSLLILVSSEVSFFNTFCYFLISTVQDIVFQLQRFVAAVTEYHENCYSVLKDANVFPIEVDLTRGALGNTLK